MKYLTLLTVLLFFGVNSIAQKAKIKDDVAYIDGVAYVNYKKGNMANEASVMALDSSTEEVFISFQDYTDPNKVSKSNPEGKVRWVEINFLTLGIKCEVDSRGHKGLVKLLYENGVYQDGKLNEEAAKRFVQKYGSKFSENRPNGNVNIIINN